MVDYAMVKGYLKLSFPRKLQLVEKGVKRRFNSL